MALVTSPSDVFELRKDGHLLARLLGGEQMGEFIAYKQLQATAAGRDRGYFDLKCGELVHTPQAAQRGGARVRLPLRDGMLCRILVGKTSTGVKKQASSQDNVFCLSYVEKTSHYNATVVDPLGLYKMSNRLLHDPTLRSAPTNSKSGHWATDEHLTWLNVGNDFAWAITSPFVTSHQPISFGSATVAVAATYAVARKPNNFSKTAATTTATVVLASAATSSRAAVTSCRTTPSLMFLTRRMMSST